VRFLLFVPLLRSGSSLSTVLIIYNIIDVDIRLDFI